VWILGPAESCSVHMPVRYSRLAYTFDRRLGLGMGATFRNHDLVFFREAIAIKHWQARRSSVGAVAERGKAFGRPRTVRESFRIFSPILREAVQQRLIVESPCRGVSLPRVREGERRSLSPDEVRALAHAIDPRSEGFVYTGAYLGLRWAELGGLLRTNLDLLRYRVRVVGSLGRFRGGNRYVKETKSNASRRTVPMPRFLAAILVEHFARVPTSEWVFPAPEGGHLNYSAFRSRVWVPAVEKAGLGSVTPHALRHTAAAIMIDQGADPLQVQRRLGHKDISTTLRIYGHLFPERDEELTRGIDRAYRRTLAAPARPALELRVSGGMSLNHPD
jgi:integrase